MKWSRIFIPRIDIIFLVATLWGIAAMGPKMLNLDGDLPRHLLVGHQTLETWSVSTIDVYSYRTVGMPSYPHEWLAQVLFAISDTILGLNGVVLFTSFVITLTFAVIYQTMQGHATPLISLFYSGLALSAGTIHILPRPHIFTYLLMAIWLLQLEKIRTGKSRTWWLFPILMLLWVNIHGMFVLGIIIWGAYIVGGIFDQGADKWWRKNESRLLLVSGLASLPMTFLSPSGTGIWKTIIGLGSNTYLTSRIPEYQPANFQLPGTWPFIFLLIFLLTGLSLNTKRLSWIKILLLSGFLALALYSSRMIPIFALVSAPIAAQAASHWIKNGNTQSGYIKIEDFVQRMGRSAGGAIWLVVSFFAIASIFVTGRSITPYQKENSFDSRVFPVAAVDWLTSNPQTGNLLNDFNWGGYILLETWPAYPIFMDGHTHIYGEMLTREYEQLVSVSPGWKSIVEKYRADWAIFPTTSKLAVSLSEIGWETLYKDDTAIVLRSNPAQ
jgi:hypothetical protein